MLAELRDEVDAVQLAFLVDHVVALELASSIDLAKRLELVDLVLQVLVVDVLRVPLRDLMELKQMSELHPIAF